MTKLSQRRCQIPGRKICLGPVTVVSSVVLGLFSIGTYAQEDNEPCPCFSFEEVESIFLKAGQMAAGDGESICKAEDFSVELKGEMTIWDQNYAVVAQARVEWMDFDPGTCAYIDTPGNPGVERNVRWPHPAPEATARLCYGIIASVIEKSDTAGKCITM